MEQAISAQRAAIQSMEQSIERQKTALRDQTGRTAAPGFFVLPPPAGSLRLAAAAAPPACEPLPLPEVRGMVQQAATRQGVDEDLLMAVMNAESGYRPCAVSSKGALGLMQLMPDTASDLEVQDPFDPRQNVDAGARFLKQLLLRYNGDLNRVLGAYHAGPARVDAADGVPRIPSTLDYIRRVLTTLPPKP